MDQEIKNNQDTVSIVVPLFNEEESFSLLHENIRASCDRMGMNYEIVYVDDGSQDQTYSFLTDTCRTDSRVRVIRFRRNYGQTAAMAAGIQAAKGQVIVSLDGDLQNDPDDIPHLLRRIHEGYDVVCGWRKDRQDKFWTRRLPSIVANWIISRLTGVKIHDNGCSLKAYRASVIKNVSLYGDLHRFIPAMSTLTGAAIAEIPVKHHVRSFGKSKYGIGRVWKVMLDIMTVKMITGFASRPGLWFGLWSVPCIGIGFMALILTIRMYFGGMNGDGMVMVAIALLWLGGGTHLLSMGIIGELIVKTGHWAYPKSLRPLPVISRIIKLSP